VIILAMGIMHPLPQVDRITLKVDTHADVTCSQHAAREVSIRIAGLVAVREQEYERRR